MSGLFRKITSVALVGLLLLSTASCTGVQTPVVEDDTTNSNIVDNNVNTNDTTDNGVTDIGVITNPIVDNTSISVGTTTIGAIKKKYGVEDQLEIKPFYNVSQQTEFLFHFNSDVNPALAVTVHTDPDCGINSTVFNMNYYNKTADGGIDVFVDPYDPVLNVKSRELENGNWGYAPIYYLSINYDMYSKEVQKLATPVIVPFTIKHDVSTPNVIASITKDGMLQLSWNKVDGAVKYNVYAVNDTFAVEREGLFNSGKVKDTLASNGTRSEFAYSGDDISMKLLGTVDGSKTSTTDLYFDPYGYGNDKVTSDNLIIEKESNGNTNDGKGWVTYQNYDYGKIYYVTAVDAKGNESAFSMAIEEWKYNDKMPHNVETSETFTRNEDYEITSFPETAIVKMCDGSKVSFPINYKLISTEFECKDYSSGLYAYEVLGTKLTGTVNIELGTGEYPKEVKSNASIEASIYEVENNINIIPANTQSTINDKDYTNVVYEFNKKKDVDAKPSYEGDMWITRVDWELARALNGGAYKEGHTPYDIFGKETNVKIVENATPAPKPTDEKKEEVPERVTSENLVEEQIESTRKDVEEANEQKVTTYNYPIFADSAEEEYLARMMIAGEEVIDLSAFPKLLNAEYLIDVWYKLHFQEPYIIGMKSVGASGTNLLVEYKYTKEEMQDIQKRAYEESHRLAEELFKDGMTDEEKIRVIWDYMDTETTYDNEALAAMGNTDDASIKKNRAAHSIEGILLNKHGVCQSYAYTVKLLCDIENIPCEVLVGTLKGGGHGWNAVKINGDWVWLDVTNTDSKSPVPKMVYQSSTIDGAIIGWKLDSRYEIDTEEALAFGITDNVKHDYYTKEGLYVSKLSDLSDVVLNARSKVSTGDMYFVKLSAEAIIEVGDKSKLSTEINELIKGGLSEEEIKTLGYMGNYFCLTKK